MSAPDTAKHLTMRGRLVKDPTSTTAPGTDGAYGGTYLGDFSEVAWELTQSVAELTAMEFGGITNQTLENGYGLVVGARLRNPDPDCLAAVFPGVLTPVNNRLPTMVWTATSRRGQLGTARAVKLLLVPESPQSELSLIAYNAIPLVRETARASWSLGEEWGLGVYFLAVPIAGGAVAQAGLLSNLVLSP